MYARRTVLKGAAGLSLATVLADPMLARAAAADLQQVSITTKGGPSGERIAGAAEHHESVNDPVGP